MAGEPTPMRIAAIVMTAKASMRLKPRLRVLGRPQKKTPDRIGVEDEVEVFMARD
jgi:hypothetical protein